MSEPTKYRVIKSRGLIKKTALSKRIWEMYSIFNSIEGLQCYVKEWKGNSNMISISVILQLKSSVELQDCVKWIFQRNYVSIEVLDLRLSDIKIFHKDFKADFKNNITI